MHHPKSADIGRVSLYRLASQPRPYNLYKQHSAAQAEDHVINQSNLVIPGLSRNKVVHVEG